MIIISLKLKLKGMYVTEFNELYIKYKRDNQAFTITMMIHKMSQHCFTLLLIILVCVAFYQPQL